MGAMFGPTIVRSEAHALSTSPAVRQDVQRTINFYRRIVRLCATVAMTHWPALGLLRNQERQMALEALLHPTAKRPVIRYLALSRAMGKMPSYLRRAALSNALGVVSSFLSNYDLWLTDAARERGTRPPRMGFSNVFPSLFGGNMIEVGLLPAAHLEKATLQAQKKAKWDLEFVGPLKPLKPLKPIRSVTAKPAKPKRMASCEEDFTGLLPAGSVRIKLLNAQGLWAFSAPMKMAGKRKRLPASGAMSLAPCLMQRGAKVWLNCPVELKPPQCLTNVAFKKERGTEKEQSNAKTPGGQEGGQEGGVQDQKNVFRFHRVCAVDVGINTAAVAAVVDATGTVITRKFFTCGRHNDQRDRLQAVIAFKQQKSGGTTRGRPFCAGLYRRIEGLNRDAAISLASSIIAFALESRAKALVLEDLKGWKPKGPSRAQRARFHRFQHRVLVKALKHKAQEHGLRVLEVYARGTSRWAYDGSGKVNRAKDNAQLATFANGRQYNADLNAAYNIAARGLGLLLGIKSPRAEEAKSQSIDKCHDEEKVVKQLEAGTGKSSGLVVRMPLVLADIWGHANSLRLAPALSGHANPRGVF